MDQSELILDNPLHPCLWQDRKSNQSDFNINNTIIWTFLNIKRVQFSRDYTYSSSNNNNNNNNNINKETEALQKMVSILSLKIRK